jgi:hypothetical protein
VTWFRFRHLKGFVYQCLHSDYSNHALLILVLSPAHATLIITHSAWASTSAAAAAAAAACCCCCCLLLLLLLLPPILLQMWNAIDVADKNTQIQPRHND